MESKDLNSAVLKRVMNKIVVSNLESEEKMKINKKKQILSLAAVIILFLSGGFITVNAATDGQLVNNIKDKIIKVVFVDDNGTEKELEGKISTDSKGTVWEIYEYNNQGSMFESMINKTYLENENMSIVEKIKSNLKDGEESIEMTIK